MMNTSGVKVQKHPRDVYKSMQIETVDEIEEREKITGPTRHYKGSMKSRFEQHAKYLSEKSKNGDNL